MAVAITLFIASCSGGSGGSVSIQLDPEALDLVLGGSGTVQVSVTRSAAATAALSLQAEGAPEWVTVQFSPVVLAGSDLESTMTVTTDAAHPDAQPSTFEVEVKAIGTGLSANSTLSVSVELMEVTGTVVDGFGGPLSGLTVLSPGKADVVTDSNGEFSFSDMSAPYDLTIVDTTGSIAHKFIGLTTAEPRVMSISPIVTGVVGESEATISGNLSHTSLIPLTAGHRVSVCIEGLNSSATGCTQLVSPGESAFELTVTWPTSSDLNARVRAYLYEVDGDGAPTAIVASGTAGPTVLSDGDAALLDLTLEDSSSQASMPVTVEPPNGYTLQSWSIISHYSDFASFALNPGTPVGLTDTLLAPFFAGAPLSAFATATANSVGSNSQSIAWSTGYSSGDSTTLTLPVPPSPIAPPDGTTDVTTATEFVVANPAGGVVTFVFQVNTPPGPVLAVTTAGTSAHIPDMAALGMGLTGGEDYNWTVMSTPHIASADEAVTGEGFLGGYVSLAISQSGGGIMPSGDGQISTADFREFTTQ